MAFTKELNEGILIDDTLLSILLYSDDIVLVAENEADLQCLTIGSCLSCLTCVILWDIHLARDHVLIQLICCGVIIIKCAYKKDQNSTCTQKE